MPERPDERPDHELTAIERLRRALRTPAPRVFPDDEILGRLVAGLAPEAARSRCTIEIKVEKGVVRLDGEVATPGHLLATERLVRTLDGVRESSCHVTVAPR